jgi:hypothetical protein
MEYPSPDDPDRFEERLRTRFLLGAGGIFLGLAIGLVWLIGGDTLSEFVTHMINFARWRIEDAMS